MVGFTARVAVVTGKVTTVPASAAVVFGVSVTGTVGSGATTGAPPRGTFGTPPGLPCWPPGTPVTGGGLALAAAAALAFGAALADAADCCSTTNFAYSALLLPRRTEVENHVAASPVPSVRPALPSSPDAVTFDFIHEANHLALPCEFAVFHASPPAAASPLVNAVSIKSLNSCCELNRRGAVLG